MLPRIFLYGFYVVCCIYAVCAIYILRCKRKSADKPVRGSIDVSLEVEIEEIFIFVLGLYNLYNTLRTEKYTS